MGVRSRDEVTMYLAIESILLASSVITDKLGVLPDKQWSVGQNRGKTGKVWDRHGWVIEVRVLPHDDETLIASQVMSIAIERFEKRLAPLVQKVAQLDSSADKYVVASIVCDVVPGIEFRPSFLKLLTEVGASFQIDIQSRLR